MVSLSELVHRNDAIRSNIILFSPLVAPLFAGNTIFQANACHHNDAVEGICFYCSGPVPRNIVSSCSRSAIQTFPAVSLVSPSTNQDERPVEVYGAPSGE